MQQNDLHDKLNDAFRPLHLSVRDDSAKHAGHAEAPVGGGSHFTVILVSQVFEGLDRVSRHRAVNQVLEEAFVTEDIHALSLRIFTPTEWNNGPA
jgi:BolA protein